MKRLEIAIPIPSSLDADDVVKVLHNHENILNNNPLCQSWENNKQEWTCATDMSLFFMGRSCTDRTEEPVTYSVVQRVERALLLGRWHSSTVISPVLLQNFDRGARCEMRLPQKVKLWCEWTVSQNLADDKWELLDYTRAEGSDRCIASVRKSVATAHLALMKAVLRISGVKDSDVDDIEVKWVEQPPGNWLGIGFA